MKKEKTIKGWAIGYEKDNIDIGFHGQDVEVETYLIMPTKKEAEKCKEAHTYGEGIIKRVEIKILN